MKKHATNSRFLSPRGIAWSSILGVIVSRHFHQHVLVHSVYVECL